MRQAEVEALLPGVFQRTLTSGAPLEALLGLMEALHDPDERILSELDRFFDPRRTEDRFVPYLASWVTLSWLFADPLGDDVEDLSRPFSTGIGRLGELIAASSFLAKWRGTSRGLTLFLEIATGMTGWEIDEAVLGADGRARPAHLRVNGPPAALPNIELVRRIVEHEKPAHVTAEVAIADADS
jgi:phage tail-like protein